MGGALGKTLGKWLSNVGFGVRNRKWQVVLPLVQMAVNPLFLSLCVYATMIAPQADAQKMNLVTAIRMAADPDHKMVRVPCQVNGDHRRYICLIDSGATNTIISDRVVKADGPFIEMTTGGGVVRVHQQEVDLTIADSLQVKAKAVVQSSMMQGVDILVGQDVLRQFKSVIFDYENARVEFCR